MKFRSFAAVAALTAIVFPAAAAELSRKDLDTLRTTPIGGFATLDALPLDALRTGPVRLKRIDVYAPDAKIHVIENGVEREIPRSDWLTFIADKSAPNAPYLALAFPPDASTLNGSIIADNGRLISLDGVRKGDALQIDAWDSTDRMRDGEPFAGTCANDLVSEMRLPTRAQADAAFTQMPDSAKVITAASRSARVAIDSDTEFMSERFSDNTTTATNWLTALFTMLNVIYERDLDVTLVAGDVFWRVGSDPYTVPNDIFLQLDEFGEVWAANHNGVVRAFAAQMSGKLASTGGFSGIAWVMDNTNYCTAKNFVFGGCDGQCTAGTYSVNQTQTNTTSATANDAKFIGHELGHNFGANHTHCSDAASGDGNPSVSGNTMDSCYSGESGSGCFGGSTSCPASTTINGVAGVRGTIMSYCHLLGGCSSASVFAPAHVSYLSPFITAALTPANQSSGCFMTGGGGTISIADRTLGEATSPMNFTLTRSNTTGTASVVVSTAAGTATGGGTDYTNVSSQTVNFTAGSATATLNVTINNDSIDEVDETFVVNLTSPSAGYTISDTQATGTITDNDTSTVSINDPAAVTEGGSVGFTVSLSTPNSRSVTVRADTANGTAVASGDFTARSNVTVTFTAGDVSEAFTVTSSDDNLNEADSEQFSVDLSNVSASAVLGDASGAGTLNDNDATPTISIADAASEAENSINPLRFVVTLSGPNQAPISVTATTDDGSATVANSDYQSRTSTVTFASGDTSENFDVTKMGDSTPELDESLAVDLTNATAGITVSDANAAGTITNDDLGPPVSIDNATLSEGDVGLSDMQFTVSIPAGVGFDVLVNYSVVPIDASAILDYSVVSGTAIIPVTATSTTIDVPIVGDPIDEWNERFTVNLTATATSTIGDGQATGTIIDDDAGILLQRDGFE